MCNRNVKKFERVWRLYWVKKGGRRGWAAAVAIVVGGGGAAVRLKVDSLKRTCWEGGWTVFSVRAHSLLYAARLTSCLYTHTYTHSLSLRQLKTRSTPFLSCSFFSLLPLKFLKEKKEEKQNEIRGNPLRFQSEKLLS